MLMLIFILHISFFVIFANFNTSHVNVNLYGYPIVGCASFHFNTSHVNPLCSIFCNKYCSISIHLMLMLILQRALRKKRHVNFNTSHVNVNRKNNIRRCRRKKYFNTSHVNVNLFPQSQQSFHFPISIHLMLMLIPCRLQHPQ